MRLARGTEVGVDADVELLVADGEPHAAAAGKRGGLGDLGEAEQLAEEPPRVGLASGRRGDLNVIETHRWHQSVKPVRRRALARRPALESEYPFSTTIG